MADPSYTPTIQQMADLLAARRVGIVPDADPEGAPLTPGMDVFGGDAGTLDATTLIKASDATAAIARVLPEVIAVTGVEPVEEFDEPVKGLANSATIYLAGADLEASFFPRQTGRDQTANEYWAGRASALLTLLAAAVADSHEVAGTSGSIFAVYPCSPLAGRIV